MSFCIVTWYAVATLAIPATKNVLTNFNDSSNYCHKLHNLHYSSHTV